MGFQIEKEFTTLFEEMSLQELNRCLQKSARKRDGLSIICAANIYHN